MNRDRSRESVHRRALSAAAGVVGRPRIQAGALALGLAVVGGCVVIDKGGDDESAGATSAATDDDESDGSTTMIADASSSGGDAGSGATEWTTDMSSGTGSESAGSTGSGDTTSDTSGTSGDTTTSGGTDTTTATEGGTDTEAENPCVGPDGEVDWECCEKNDWMPFPQCTPWGPPAPPAYRAPVRGALV